jgi:hypothetical protein
MAQVATLLNCNQEGPRSNLGQGSTIMTDVFSCFSQPFQVNARTEC